MTYNEWRDELKSNLLCVSEQERVRVLDYYAEAYADRRDAGFSEREITAEFGAPYDAARRILLESGEGFLTNEQNVVEDTRYAQPNSQIYQDDDVNSKDSLKNPQHDGQKSTDNTWIFVLLCVLFAAPIFGVVMGMAGVTIGFCAAPFALIIAAVATIGEGVGLLFSDFAFGSVTIGMGLTLFGLALMITPIFIKLVKLMWKLFGAFFSWLKSLFGKKEIR